MQVGEQAINVARNAVLAAGWPETVPGTTVDRQCGSSQQAAHFAAQGVIAGAYDVVVAGGVEVMTRVPMGSSMADGKFGWPFGPAVGARYADQGGLVPQGISAELVADKWNLTRERARRVRGAQPAARRHGHRRGSLRAGDRSRCSAPTGRWSTRDEGLRDTTVESLAKLKPSFRSEEEGGRITAGNSSQITDGASAVLIMSEEKAAELGLTPRARFVEFALAGADPRLMLTAPIPATQKVLDRAGLAIGDIDLVEINEAFASVVLAWQQEIKADMRHGQRQRRGDRPRPPARCFGHPAAGHAGLRARARRTAATACRRCARAAAWPTPRSSRRL